MSKQASFTKGYYSILQYVPDLERAEGVNVGVALICPERDFLKARTVKDNSRIKRFFKNAEIDLKRLTALKEAFEERIEAEAKRILTVEEFQHFIDTRANNLRLTSPRQVKLESPEVELQRLFESLVEDDAQVDPATRSITEVKKQFRELIKRHNLSDKVKERVAYQLPLLGKCETYPFGYRNGQPNVVDTVSFEATDERAIEDRACRVVVEGQDLSRLNEPVKLNIIGSFRPDQQERAAHIRRLLEENRISLHTASDIEALVEEIAATAH